MANSNPDITTTPQPTASKGRQLKLIATVIVIVLLAGGLGIYLHSKSNKPSQNATANSKTQPVAFKKVTPYTAQNAAAGSQVSLSVPSTIKQTFSDSATGQFTLDQTSGKPPVTTSVVSESQQAVSGISLDLIKDYGDALTDSNNSSHGPAVQLLQTFAEQRLTGYKVTIGNVSALTTANLTSNAWAADFSAPAGSANGGLPMTGKIVAAYGQTTLYYFLLADSNWQANAAIWQQTIDSLKVDQ